ncbi:MAG: ComEC/Rec2 family competence protein [Hyphomicrobiales bacterium]
MDLQVRETEAAPSRFTAWAGYLEAESRRTTIWSAIALTIGIWLYFSLTWEPNLWLLTAVLAAALLCGWRGLSRPAWVLVAAMLLGFGLPGLRALHVGSPLVGAYAPEVIIAGHVSDLTPINKGRVSLMVDVDEALGLPPDETPRRIKLEARADAYAAEIGDHIRATASVVPLPRPLMPGGFEYARSLYFQSVGATGWTNVAVQLSSEDIPARYWPQRMFNGLRKAIGNRVRAHIAGPLGSFADALITGERASIPRSMIESLQKSGLFHILSISGLHMAMVAGGTFWLVRALLALFPSLALRRPIKKWAAALALLVGLIYDLMADSGPATDRSFIMIAVMFFAMMVDRPAISLNNLAIAALIILMAQPEQAVAASFQMSFMAVMGLAGFFEWWDRRNDKEEERPRRGIWRLLHSGWKFTVASILTSLIAGGLSGIPAAHHFGRLAPYGVVANALALPVVGIVMPAALAATLLMPFGLEAAPLWVTGLKVVMLISDWVASWPHGWISVPPMRWDPHWRWPPQRPLTAVALVGGQPAAALGLSTFASRPCARPAFEDPRPGPLPSALRMATMPPPPTALPWAAVKKWRESAGHRKAVVISPWTCVNNVCTASVRGRSVALSFRLRRCRCRRLMPRRPTLCWRRSRCDTAARAASPRSTVSMSGAAVPMPLRLWAIR